jgi:hypothetical protein
MKKLIILLLICSCFSINAQNIAGLYIWKPSETVNDSIVCEIEIQNNSTYTYREYSIDKSNVNNINYKNWAFKTKSEGKIEREKGFYKLIETAGNKILNGSLIKIKRNEIWFYGYRQKDFKLVRCKPLTFKRASFYPAVESEN